MTTCRLAAVAFLLVSSACKKDAGPTLPAGEKVLTLKVTEEGFEPTPITVKQGEPLVLNITRVTDKTCATEILIDGTDINVPLPLHQTVAVRYTPSKSGQIRYGCAMGMMISGVLVVE